MSTAQLKMIIFVLIVLMLISLFNSLFVLFQDNGAPESKRLLHRLIIRVSLATALLATMIYGFYSGKLHSSAPWNNPAGLQQPKTQQPSSP